MPGGISLVVLHSGKKETTMRFDSQPLRHGFDWDFRPKSYFDLSAARTRKLPEPIGSVLGRIHPAFMGGQFLPELDSGEVEIARVQLESVTADEISVRARPVPSGIAYRVVDEHENTYRVKPARSKVPLTLAELEYLMSHAWPGGGVPLAIVKDNVEGGGSDLINMYGFATVSSRYYPEIGAWYERLIGAWLDSRGGNA